MELEHRFTVPVNVDDAWRILTDIERIAPCMPGATLESADGDGFNGRVKVKVGAMQLTYKGRAEFTELDPKARRAVMLAKGQETRGTGTANATVTATLEASSGDATAVLVHSDIDITGKPAQFGRGVMSEVGDRLLSRFAERLAEQLAAGESLQQSTPASATSNPALSGPGAQPGDQDHGDDDAIDLWAVAAGPIAKRMVPPLIAAVVLLLLVLWRRRSDG